MSLERLICLPDLHAPYHDQKALALVSKVAKDWRPRICIQIGDLGDNFQISAYGKGLDRLPLDEEIKETRKARALIDGWDSLRVKKMTLGNHCARWEKWLQDPRRAAEIEQYLGYGREVTVDGLWQLSKHGWEVTPYRDFTKVGKVYFTHDYKGGGKFATNAAGDAFKHSVVIGHHHRMQMFVLGNAVGDVWGAWQFGWLGDPEYADYEHRMYIRANWTPGFGVGIHDTKSGHITFQPVPIIDYTAEVGGKVYRG